MSDAWIVGGEEATSSDTARALAELGFRPLRMVSGETATRESLDGSTSRVPAIAIVLGDISAVLALRRMDEMEDVPMVLTVDANQIGDELHVADVDELLVRPYGQAELKARITRARKQVNGIAPDDVVRVGTLEINLATYQVTIEGHPIDFTYMEYELLRFLATHPNRVFGREALLSRVWGYDYYGGARTVDVHVRRVRAKLGAEHAERLVTVRSVGYRFEVRQ